jgi:dolichyl-diphosphooligosaccharide--protein glycosyltransferase
MTTANRFILFMIPLVALGTGYAGAVLWKLLQKIRPINTLVCIGLAVALSIPLITINGKSVRMPKEPGFMVKAMYAIRERTPEDAVIWAWWDHGYALTYYSRRATINDGSIHGGELTVLNALPYTTDSFRLAANFMQFYVSRGMAGINRTKRLFENDPDRALRFIKAVLEAGPEKARAIINDTDLIPKIDSASIDTWLQFFFPENQRPIYLVCDNLLNRTAHWWYWFGTWDIKRKDGTHPKYRAYNRVSMKKKIITGSPSLVIDRVKGTFIDKNRRLPLAQIQLHSDKGSRTVNNYWRDGLRFDFNKKFHNGAVMDKGIADSVFSRLFIRLQPDETYFKPVINSPPLFQLWQVSGDSFSG